MGRSSYKILLVFCLTIVLSSASLLTQSQNIAHAASNVARHWSWEDGQLDGWTLRTSASTMGPLIASHPNFHHYPNVPYNKEGTYFLSTLEGPGGTYNDGNTGVVTSPTFTLVDPIASMLVGGGNGPDTYVAACVYDTTQAYNCRQVAKVQGNNSETLQYRTMNLAPYLNDTMFFEVYDESVGNWGHVTLDDVRVNAPSMPTKLTTVHDQGGSLLSWQAVTDIGISGYDVIGYNIYRSTSQMGGFTRLNTSPITASTTNSPPNTVTYWDGSANANTAYYYKVSALGSDGSESEQNITYADPYINLFARGSTTTYSGANLTGIEFPVGPLGAGGILHFGNGTRNEGWIVNVGDHFNGRTTGIVPNSFFAVRVQPSGGKAIVRALQTTPVGSFPATQSLTFQGEYPLASYQFSDSALPVQVTEKVENPMIPGDLKNSAIPTAIYDFTLRNTGGSTAQVSLLATQQNAVGYDGASSIGGANNDSYSGYGSNANTVVHTQAPSGTQIQMTGSSGTGSMNLDMLANNTTATASWTDSSLYSSFLSSGTVRGPTSSSSPVPQTTIDGAVASSISLNAGQSITIPVVLSWYFPISKTNFSGTGMQYTNWWSSAANVDQYVTGNLTSLQSNTQHYHDTLYHSNLPQDVLDRITSAVSILHTPTVFWSNNGFFGGWEGYGCCSNMPNHVWEYAQGVADLWPQIGELWDKQWLSPTNEQSNGLIPYRFRRTGQFAFDGQAGNVLMAYRDYLNTGDSNFLSTYWPQIKGAMNYMVTTFDPNRDGILVGSALTTLDRIEPTACPWLGSMYLAAINASAHMAALVGDTADATAYQSIYSKGQANQEKAFWNGSYYVENAPNPGSPNAIMGNASDVDMLLGQWWSTQLGLGNIYNPQHMTQALYSLYTNNYQRNFLGTNPFDSAWYQYSGSSRDFVEPQDGGLVDQTWPKNDIPPNHISYYGETQSGYEYAAAAEMLQRGLLDQGLTEIDALSRRYDGRLRNDSYLHYGGCGIGDGSGNPFGDDECGKWYGRSLSSWSALLALQGFSENVGAHTIGFAPTYLPANHTSFFTAGTSWGTFAQTQGDGTQSDTIALAYGNLKLNTVNLETASGDAATGVSVAIDGHLVSGTSLKTNASSATVIFPAITLVAGSTLHVQFNVQQNANTPILGHTYTIASVNSGSNLDVSNSSTANYTPIIQYHATGGTNQQWTLLDAGNGAYYLRNVNSNSCLDISAYSLIAATNAVQYSCHDGINQQWRITPTGSNSWEISNVNSGLCLDVDGASKSDGAAVRQLPYQGSLDQQWLLKPI